MKETLFFKTRELNDAYKAARNVFYEGQTQMLYTTLKKITFQKLAASIDESLFSQMSFLSNGLKADFDNVKNYCIKHC